MGEHAAQIPKGNEIMIHGVDVSANNSNFSTSGLGFVIIKATEGHSYTSPIQSKQASAAREAGCVVGFYHFLWPDDIKEQAKYFVEKAASEEGDLLAVDWERTSDKTAASSEEKDKFLDEVNKLRSEHRVLLYCNRDFWLNRDTSSHKGDGLWIADYRDAGKPDIEAKWIIHQYTSTPLDKNVANFEDKHALKKWATSA